MSKISTYSLADEPLQLSDRLIGTEAPRPTPSPTPLATKNFSLGELLQLFSANFPAATLQAVLNAGNIATQNITLTGTINTTVVKPTNIEDVTGSQGSTFEFLSKAVSGINWVSLPVDNLQAVLNAGNTATQNIILTGDITSTKIIPGNIQDDTSSIGTTGQVLSKTASGIRWINNPTVLTPGLNDVLSVGNTSLFNAYVGEEFGLWDNANSGYMLIKTIDNSFIFEDSAANKILSMEQSIFSFFKSNTIAANLNSTSLTASRSYSFPDQSGTIALLSDIPPYVTPTLDSVLLEGNVGYAKDISLLREGDSLSAAGGILTLLDETTGNIGNAFQASPFSAILSDNTGQLELTKEIITKGDGVNSTSLVWETLSSVETITIPNKTGTLALISDIPTGGGLKHGTASGTDTYAVTITDVTSYADGDAYLIRFTNGNTTSATLNINSLGAIPLYRNNDGPLIGGDVLSNGEMLCVYNSTSNIFQCIGVAPNTLLAYVTNDESVTITRGQAVYVSGGVGDRVKVKLAYNTADLTSAQTIGIVSTASIAPNQKGIIIVQGQLDNLSLFPTSTWADGDYIYLGATPGTITNVKPVAPNHLVYLGYVTTASNGSAGRMYVKVQNGYELQELHNVYINPATLANYDGIFYNSATSLWENKNVSQVLPERRNANNSTNNNINYCGTADKGSAESSAVWTIERLTIGSSGSVTIGTATNVAWTNRESVIYT
jgi:hypothetical protein